MRNLETNEKEFLEGLKKYSVRLIGGYFKYNPRNKTYGNTKYKRSRVNFMLHHGVWLEKHEIIHHKDGNKQNDAIENLEVIDTFNFNALTSKIHGGVKKPGSGNHECKTKQEVIDRAKEIAAEMTRLNCSEIARRLEKEEMKISSATLAKYLKDE